MEIERGADLRIASRKEEFGSLGTVVFAAVGLVSGSIDRPV